MDVQNLLIKFVFVWIAFSCCYLSAAYKYAYMNSVCGQTIYASEETQVELHFSYSLDTCEVTIAKSAQYPNMMLFFESFNIDCSYGNVQLTDDYNYTMGGLDRKLCGFIGPLFEVKTLEGNLHVKYIRTKEKTWGWESFYLNSNDKFTLTVTMYADEESCPSDGHVCGNGRCVSENLRCNSKNSCGDYSGCWTRSNTLVIMWSVMGSVFGFVLIVSVIVISICCRRRSRGFLGQTNAPAPTQPMFTTASAMP
ncbi:hypothetical protein MAR_026791 [Mya arenaria]|uniref:CUB domain-containing protein n=1 Tax=Mya arenaria TaxID=6604 RepID=A0ABY7EZP1_MYAAR|nr:uncharacterized protein LOC128243774 [Mya arenaria]WAR12611.1 hypothetical protein MAR_026791 [Mya arenaria]